MGVREILRFAQDDIDSASSHRKHVDRDRNGAEAETGRSRGVAIQDGQQELVIGGETIAAGTRRRVVRNVFRDIDDSELNVHAHVVRGERPGPTLTLSAMLHGDEWFMLEITRAILEAVRPEGLRGTLIALPVAN